jgi:hypothetical protein
MPGDHGASAAGTETGSTAHGAVDAAHGKGAQSPALQGPALQGDSTAPASAERRLKTGRSIDQPAPKAGSPHEEPANADARGDQSPAGRRTLKTGRSVAQPEPKAAGDHDAAPGATEAATDGDASPGPAVAGHAAERDFEPPDLGPAHAGKQHYRPGSYFRFEGMPAGITAEQINAAWQRVQQVTTELEHRRVALDLRERELGALADDVARRQSELGRERTELEALQKRLDERIEQFREQVKLVRTDEVAGLKRNAATLASFEPQKAAELVQEQWKTEKGQDEVLKVLEFMDKDAVNSILKVLPNSMIREVLEKRLRVSKEAPAGSAPGAGGKGG